MNLPTTTAPSLLDHRGSSRLLLWGCCFLVAAAMGLALDLPIWKAVQYGTVPGDLRKLLLLSEVFAHGLGVLLIIVTIWILDPANRRKLLRVTACAYGAGLLANAVKLCVARYTPHVLAEPENVWQTFAGFFPVVTSGNWRTALESPIQSFPSGHAATAVGLAIGLAWLYPHGARWFFLLALFASLQRICFNAHYLSDTLAAAGLACLVGHRMLHSGKVARWFDRFEENEAGALKQPDASAAKRRATLGMKAEIDPGAPAGRPNHHQRVNHPTG